MKPVQKVELLNKKIRPRDNSQPIECYFYSDGNLTISFPKNEGWAELLITTTSGETLFKDRFHTTFDYSAYIGIPEEPWKITIITTQGGEYEGYILQL